MVLNHRKSMEIAQKIVVVAGPTGSGKSEVAIRLAKEFNGELICSDSMQVYRKLDIGTAKPTKKELSEANHHFINNISVEDKYSSGIFSREANAFLSNYFLENDYAILVGGSGLFIDSVIYGLDDMPKVPESFRNDLNELFKKEVALDERKKV